MKHLKKFESYRQLGLEKFYDLAELDDILIDFKQMGLDYSIKSGSFPIIDWALFKKTNSRDTPVFGSSEISKYKKNNGNNVLKIEMVSYINREIHQNTYNFDDVIEGYEMLKNYLFDNYGLIPNYIHAQNCKIQYQFSNLYFENLGDLKEHKLKKTTDLWRTIHQGEDSNFKANILEFTFYKI